MSGIELATDQGDLDVQEAYLRMPDQGNWIATCAIGWPSKPTVGTPATLRITRASGALDTFTGTVRRSEILGDAQRVSVSVVGGAGRLLTSIPARHHTSGPSTVPAGVVLAGIVGAAQETLAAGVEAAIDAIPLQRYTRLEGEAGQGLDVLASVLGMSWRVLSDGTMWMGTETWPAADASVFYTSGDPRDGMVLYAPDGAPFRPGTTIDGARAVEVSYWIIPGKARMEVRASMPGDPVRRVPLDAYGRSYTGTVKLQHTDDLSLDIEGASPVLGKDLRRIPYQVAFAGSKTTIPEGSIVQVRFANGLPTGAYATDINQDAAASKALALKDDDVDSGSLIASVNVPPGGGVVPVDFIYKGGAPATSIEILGKITGPCHKYAKGVPAS